MDEATKQLINILVSQSSNFKEMLLWSIGSIITLIVVFLGANYFTMRSFRKEEISRIKSEIELNIQNEYLPKIRDQIKHEIELELNRSIMGHTKNITSLQSKTDRILKKIESESNYTEHKLKRLEADLKFHLGNIVFDSNRNFSALSFYLQTAHLYVATNFLNDMGGILDDIEKTLDKINKLDNYDKQSIQRLLNSLGDNFIASKESIQQKILSK